MDLLVCFLPKFVKRWAKRRERDSNPRSSVYETDALATWPPRHTISAELYTNSILVYWKETAYINAINEMHTFILFN